MSTQIYTPLHILGTPKKGYTFYVPVFLWNMNCFCIYFCCVATITQMLMKLDFTGFQSNLSLYMCGEPEHKLHCLYQAGGVYLDLFSYLFFPMNFRCSSFGNRIFMKPQCKSSIPNRVKDTEATRKKGIDFMQGSIHYMDRHYMAI